jgi:predicted permease
MAVRYSAVGRVGRRLGRTPLFTAISILTLAVGIGANAAIFSVVYGVLLKPLPFVQPDRLVGLWHRAPGMGLELLNQSPATYFTYRENARTFVDVGLWQTFQVTLTGRNEPERVQALAVTDGVLSIVGVQPEQGRLFTTADDSPGAPARVILTHGYWQRKFGARADVIGRTLHVDGTAREVIGVLPASFKFLRESPALLMPMQLDRSKTFIGEFNYTGIGRLKPGMTTAMADAEIARLIPTIVDRFPLPPGFTRQMFTEIRMAPLTRPLSEDVIGDVGKMLWILLGTVGVVLLIACANVANLFLVRTEGRQQELAVRAALGASRRRIAAELFSESIALALAGGMLGLVLAQAGLALLVKLAPAGLPRIDEIGIDSVVLAFSAVVSLVAALLFGALPMLKFGTPGITALREGGRSQSEGPERHRARNTLVVSEVALALVLLIVSGLMVRTFIALRQVEPGFVNPEAVQTFRLAVPDALVPDPENVARLYQQIDERIARLPGVTSVGLTSSVTMDGSNSNDPIFVEDRPQAGGQMPPLRRFKWIGPRFVETMGNHLVAGRSITWTDIYQKTPVALVSESFAREFWPTPAMAIGKRIRQSPSNPWREIIGVVAPERDNGLNAPAPTIIYWPLLVKDFWTSPLFVDRYQAFVVRASRVQSPGFLRELQQAVWSVNPNLPLANTRTLVEIRAESMAQTSFALTMLAIAAAVALLLGIVGIYGIIAYIAAQRTREIGIRMALGAQARDVSRLFIAQGLRLTTMGIVVGVAVSLALTRLMSTLLFGVTASDPITYLAVSLLLGGIALLATYLPARRASRIEPMVALRSDG